MRGYPSDKCIVSKKDDGSKHRQVLRDDHFIA